MKIARSLAIITGIATDFAVKVWARDALDVGGPAVNFFPFISLRLAFNQGISFGLLAHDSQVAKSLLVGMTGVITAVMTIWAYRTRKKWEGEGLMLIVAGSWANVIDRAIFGRVTDYLALNFGSWHPFIFNLADIWISVGVCFFMAQFRLGLCKTAARNPPLK